MKFFLFAFLLFSKFALAQIPSIIPQPQSVQIKSGNFVISSKTVIAISDENDRNSAAFFNDYLQKFYGFSLNVQKQSGKNYIRLITKKSAADPEEGYTLNVTADGIVIEGNSYPGSFYGVQSLIQLLPVPETLPQKFNGALTVPMVKIQDAPRFPYRGMHLDVTRHMFPVDYLKKYIDYIALHKMNFFHWHLTDDQGWRIEIKKYPELTQIGAWRNGTIIGRYPGIGNDNIRYGGYYTQDEVREIIQYAADRHITVVPEIEMPGHASAALTSFPWLGCPGTGPYKVEETWGVFDDIFCAGSDSTFFFLQDVIDEVIALFPSKYIHVGGDESPRANWKICPRCQKRIKDNGLKDEHELQSYFVQRMEKYINSKGRTIIGWDEILEGGLAPNAIVMSWRGEAGGIEAAKQKHHVIMTPGSHLYFDHSQTADEDSVTIGGLTTIEKTYSYDPVPKELSAEEAKYIMGAQANLWTEYIGNTRKIEYHIFPRLSALSEIVWSPKETRNWNNFEKRLLTQFNRYKLWGANYSKAYYDVTATILPTPANYGVALKLAGRSKDDRLVYSVNGKHTQKKYTGPIVFTENAQVTAMYYKGNELMDSVVVNLHVNKATGRKITLAQQPSSSYPGNGAFTLVDGIINEKGGRTNQSVGFQSDVEATIDLGSVQQVSGVVAHALKTGGTYVYPPESLEVSGSTDGENYQVLGISREITETKGTKVNVKASFSPVAVRFIKVKVNRLSEIPKGQRGEGQKPWLFLDEIQVN